MRKTQILHQPADQQPERLAQKAHTSIKRERARQQRRADLRKAAERIADAYRNDPELTAFTVLDGELLPTAPE